MKFRLLVNPAAGRGRTGSLYPRVARWMESRRLDFDIFLSEGPGHLSEMARSFAVDMEKNRRLVVCGGDGSINEVINGLGLSPPPLGLIPGGTGDDIARNLGIPRTVEEACALLLSGEVRSFDLVSAGGRLFAGIGGAGVDSEVTRRANSSRIPFPGRTVYLWAVLTTLASFRPYLFTVTADGWRYRGRVMFVAVANAPSYGGGLRLSPPSSMNDGLLELCIVEEMGRLELLRNVPRLLRGTHLSHPRIRYRSVRSVRLESETPVDFFADGEYQSPLPLDISILPGAFRALVPG